MYDFPKPTKVLSGHTTPENAYLVPDYPYGRQLRCQCRWWMEFKPNVGFRMMRQTNDPKKPGVVWNKPHASTYGDLMVMYLDDKGHLQQVSIQRHALESWPLFFELYADGLKEGAWLAVAARFQNAYAQRFPVVEKDQPKTNVSAQG